MAYPLTILPDPSGQVGRLLDAAVKVTEHEPEAVLVGGLAVICTIAATHRITLDADALGRTPSLLHILRARPDATTGDSPQGVRLSGELVEVIEVQPVTYDQVTALDDPTQRLFIAAHWWAYASAEPRAIHTDADSTERLLRVATPAALVATKTAALVGRKSDAKSASDLYDLLLLAEHFPVEPQLNSAPNGVGALVKAFLSERLDDATERTRLLRLCLQAGYPDVSPQRLEMFRMKLLGS